MTDSPFNLRGKQESFHDLGRREDETYKSIEFELKPGLVIGEIEHQGRGDFKLEFIRTGGFSREQANAASIGSGIVASAAIDRIVPLAGSLLRGLMGGAVRFLPSGEISPTNWTPVDDKGECSAFRIARVREDDQRALLPGKYRLEVKSTSRWSCRFIQPALGQGMESLITEPDDAADDNERIKPTPLIAGPFKPVRRPPIARIQHNGGGVFDAEAFSVDGTHYCAVYQREGQFYVEDQMTDIIPGKEYILYVYADGEWSLDFTEGY